MTDIISCLKAKPFFVSLKRATPEMIEAAQSALGLVFSDEYKHYVSVLGVASYYGHELTGVCPDQTLSVVAATLSEREFASDVPAEWYVVERTGVDGIVVWQDSVTGLIYRTAPKTESVRIADSLFEYVSCEE